MSYDTIKIAGMDTVIDKQKFAMGNLVSKDEVTEDAYTIFELYDTGVDSIEGFLDSAQINNLMMDIEVNAGEDAILSEDEIAKMLENKGIKNPTQTDINATKYLIEVISNKSKGINAESDSPLWDGTTKDLSAIENNKTFELDELGGNVTVTKNKDGSYNIQGDSSKDVEVEFLNRKTKGAENVQLQDGDEFTTGGQVWFYSDGKLENTGLDKETYTTLFPDGINGDSFKQGMIGDCFLLAAMASVADNPDTKINIARMFSAPEGLDGSIQVTFPGQEENPIEISKKQVKKMKPGLIGRFCNKIGLNFGHVGSSFGFIMLERAYGQLELIQNKNDKYDYDANSVVDLNYRQAKKALNGGCSLTAMENLVGVDGEYIAGADDLGEVDKEDEEGMRAFLDDAAANPDKYIMTTSSADKRGVKFRTEDTHTKIYNYHAYSISRVDSDNGHVYLKNPHNTSKELCLTYDEFINSFSEIKFIEV